MGVADEVPVRSELSARDINEDIERSHDEAGREGYVRVVCECADVDCDRVLAVTRAEYEAVRRDARRFVLAKEHVRPGIESVVAETERFVVVEKDEGTPGEVAEEHDPRA
jgi:hypothetical protein